MLEEDANLMMSASEAGWRADGQRNGSGFIMQVQSGKFVLCQQSNTHGVRCVSVNETQRH